MGGKRVAVRYGAYFEEESQKFGRRWKSRYRSRKLRGSGRRKAVGESWALEIGIELM